ncbi:hypothetical protein K438DRAFT_1758827 [Mycena galopus ATCC 62051]|nr:hypothetical protein K438DRAFT_1758827 [Mycena galopus ATCC 62051]
MARGQFYDDVTKQWLTRYGYNLGVEENVEGRIDDWEPVNRKEGLTGEELAKENDFQDGAKKALRLKLSNWFRHRFTGKRLHSAGVDKILRRMRAMSGNASRPRRKANVAVYSKKYYTSKLKEGFDAMWEGAKTVLPPSVRVSTCQEYVRSCWEGEGEEVKREIAAEADALHEAAMEEFRVHQGLPEQSAEEYHEALQTFDEVGIPLADALAERLGMHVIILAVGPVGDQRGEVRLRSVFSDTSGGQTSKIWGEFDWAAFTAAEVSLTRYERAFFTKDQCRARAWPLDGEGLEGLIPMAPEGMGATQAPPAPVPPALPAPVPPALALTPTPVLGAPGPTVQTSTPVPSSPPAPLPPASSSLPPPPSSSPRPASLSPSRSPSPWPPQAPMELDQWRWVRTQLDLCEMMGEKEWGPRWRALREAVVQYKASQLWRDSPLLRSRLRPEEIATWMKEHRKAGDFEKLKPNIAGRMLAWWRDIGPSFRSESCPEDLAEDQEWPPRPARGQEPAGAWTMLRTSGNNGMLLVVQALTWWGQSIVSEAAGGGLEAGKAVLGADVEWQYMLEDVLYSLGAMTEAIATEDMEQLEKDRAEELAERAEAERERTKRREARKKSGKKTKPTSTKARAPQVKSKRASAKQAKSQSQSQVEKPARAQRKRKRDAGEEAADQPAAQRVRTEPEPEARPKPKPRFRGAPSTQPNLVATRADGEATSASGAQDAEMGTGDPAGPTSPSVQIPEDDSENHPFGNSFGDPFNSADGLTPEERADLEVDLAMDHDGDKDDSEEEEEGE